MSKPLLTIAIPTYNRAEFLKTCLEHVLPQIAESGDCVELIVSDNCSEDGTQALVGGLLEKGEPIQYVRNASNIGPDNNFVQCLRLATGNYFLLLGDDDLLLDGALGKLLPILEAEHPGVAHLGSYPFKEHFMERVPKRKLSGEILRYTDKAAFARKVHIMLTFISANVVDITGLRETYSPEAFIDTKLVQLSWILPAMLGSNLNIVIDSYMVAAKGDNTIGGYGCCKVFGEQMNRVFREFEKRGADPAIFDAINKQTIKLWFPDLILRLRKNQGALLQERFASMLYPVFKRYSAFWGLAMPVCVLPLPLAKIWYKGCRKLLKLTHRWQ